MWGCSREGNNNFQTSHGRIWCLTSLTQQQIQSQSSFKNNLAICLLGGFFFIQKMGPQYNINVCKALRVGGNYKRGIHPPRVALFVHHVVRTWSVILPQLRLGLQEMLFAIIRKTIEHLSQCYLNIDSMSSVQRKLLFEVLNDRDKLLCEYCIFSGLLRLHFNLNSFWPLK
jgi:hypothetical protein